jgi:rhodanese-related sulfurtransferase
MRSSEELIKTGQATIIDVRTPAEYAGGHVANSINIPLNEVAARIDEIKSKKNIVLCCASGNRSGMATEFLKQNGIECENGGSWLDVNCLC